MYNYIRKEVIYMLEILELTGFCPDTLQEGFSAYRTNLEVSDDTVLTGWTVSSPYFSGDNFNATTGIYTVPLTGVYAIEATINYATTAIEASLGTNINPAFIVKRTSTPTADLIKGLFPMIDLNLTLLFGLLSVRAILGSSTVTLAGVARLTEDETLELFYDANGMTLDLILQDIVWSVYRLPSA